MPLTPRRAAAVLVALALPGCAPSTVTRRIEGALVEGRFVHPAAYAAFAVGAAAEARGDDGEAALYFARALESDEDSPELWTRLGAVRCRVRPRDAASDAATDDAFRRAEALDPSYAPLFLERARCERARGRPAAALAAAERALALDPESLEVATAHADALAAAGRADDARHALAAAALFFGRESAPPRPSAGGLAAVDAALLAGDLAAARRRARGLGLDLAEVGARAAAWGRLPLAREAASALLGADPEHGGARLVLAVVADLAGDDALLATSTSPARPRSASPLARLLYAELLARRVSLDAARAFASPLPDVPPADALTLRVRERVRVLLTTTPEPPPTPAAPSPP